LSSILLRRSSVPFQSYAFRTGLCSAGLPVNRIGARSTATRARVKTFTKTIGSSAMPPKTF
jgi:hypothetical protein